VAAKGRKWFCDRVVADASKPFSDCVAVSSEWVRNRSSSNQQCHLLNDKGCEVVGICSLTLAATLFLKPLERAHQVAAAVQIKLV
jgi:hypothetical protein